MNQQRLGKTRDTDQQTMAARQQRIKSGGDDFLLANNDLGDFILKKTDPGRKLVEYGGGIGLDDWRRRERRGKSRFVRHILARNGDSEDWNWDSRFSLGHLFPIAARQREPRRC